ncbi:MAG: tetratricopeptide repeat protein [Deltaproteobacteria bacterium]|nr:MAG: tetratricopeptide repeat protein [Deltaproteobacteria bacterium]
MRRIRLWHLNVALYAALAILGFAYRAELLWAARALPIYIGGGFPTLREEALLGAALQNIQRGGETARSRALLERSLDIDPNSKAVVLLAETYLQEGNRARALELFERYLEIDPSFLFGYLRAAEIYRHEGREEDRARLLAGGLAYFSRSVEQYRPRRDPSVEDGYNQKAEDIYAYYQEALRRLRESQ